MLLGGGVPGAGVLSGDKHRLIKLISAAFCIVKEVRKTGCLSVSEGKHGSSRPTNSLVRILRCSYPCTNC